MKTIKTILSLAVLTMMASACGNGTKTPDLNYAQNGYWGNNPNGGGSNGTNTQGSGQCTGAVNIQNIARDGNHEYSACKTGQGLTIKPSTTNFNEPVCIFFAQNGNPLAYQCINLSSAGQSVTTQASFNSIYVARTSDSSALYSCFQISANNPSISVLDCAASYGISFAFGGL
ncbi:MAG: hypothetical protein EBX52_03815 [Proteobacteria bacterium]|nr:hypothetical protein [Pseudomonadota bacterium]